MLSSMLVECYISWEKFIFNSLPHFLWGFLCAKFILPGERKSHHELEQSVFSVIRQSMGPVINHGLSKTDVPRSE